ASNAITRLADVAVLGQSFTTSVPAQSITLFVVSASSAPPNQAPVARATPTPASGNAPLAVAFDGPASSDADGPIGSYVWTLGDGGGANGPIVNHPYTTAGSDSAALTVTDNLGATGTTTIGISVNPGQTAPAAPSNLTASVGANRLVTLNWR